MRVKVFLLLLISFSLLFSFSLPAWSEDKDKQAESTAYDLGEVLVTGGKAPTSMDKTAITTEITAEQIQATNSRTVSEALSHAPGVKVSTGTKNQPSISLHGFSQMQILVLIDGVPYYETKYHYLDLNQIPTDAVEKIVVTKGAASVLYGANALGGVVNIVTKKAVATPRPLVSATTEVGDGGYNREVFSSGWKKGIFSYWLSYTRDELPAWRLSDDFEPKLGTFTWGNPASAIPAGHHLSSKQENAFVEDGGYRDNSYMKSNSIFAKFGIEPNPDSEYFVNFFYITREKGMPLSIFDTRIQAPAAPVFSSIANIPNYDDWDIDLSGKQKICDQLTVQAKLFYHDHMDDYYSYFDRALVAPTPPYGSLSHSGIWVPDWDNIKSRSRYRDSVVGGKFFAEYQPISWDILRFSYHAQRDIHKQRDDENLPFAESWGYTNSMGMENEFNLIKNLSVVAGVSRDWFQVERSKKANYDSHGNFTSFTTNNPGHTKYDWNPMGGLNYQLDQDTRIFTSVGRKSRYPTLNELYSGQGGNPSLKSESSVNTTAGIDHYFGKFAWVEVSYFYHDVKNWISRNSPGPGNTFVNFGALSMQGFELNSEFYLPVKDLVLTFDYMYDYARDNSEGRVTNKVSGIPLHKFDAGLKYIVPRIGTKLNFDAVYIGKSYYQVPTVGTPSQALIPNPTQMTFDCRVSQKFLNYFEAYMAMDNMLDRYYCSEYGFPAPGRTFWFGLTAKY